MTWFRAETEVEWLKGFGEYEQVRAAAFAVLKCFVNSL
jgi:hypothetical protein